MISSQLKGFFKAYSKWLKDGAASDEYRRCAGLCSSVIRYANMADFDNMKLHREMQDLFKSEGLHENYPFNSGSAEFYETEMTNMSSHLNEKRIAFVEKWSAENVGRLEGFLSFVFGMGKSGSGTRETI